jgi:hypothetical protein
MTLGKTFWFKAFVCKFVAAFVQYGLVPVLILSSSGQVAFSQDSSGTAGCIAVPGIQASIEKFLGEVSAVQAAGQGSLSVRDALFGISELSAADQAALDRREPVQVAKLSESSGSYSNRGPGRITVEGMFAARDTYFRIPKLVLGKYALSDAGVTLTYDPAHTVQVGESVLGMKFFKAMHRTVISRTRLLFYFDANDGTDPDRCYLVAED